MSKEIVCDKCGKSSRDLKGYNKLNHISGYPYNDIENLIILIAF